jgi:hypothetical protein
MFGKCLSYLPRSARIEFTYFVPYLVIEQDRHKSKVRCPLHALSLCASLAFLFEAGLLLVVGKLLQTATIFHFCFVACKVVGVNSARWMESLLKALCFLSREDGKRTPESF